MATNADSAGPLFASPAIAAVDAGEPRADGSLILRSADPLGDYPVTVVHSLRAWAQAEPGRLQPFGDDRRERAQHGVSEGRIGVAATAYRGGVERDRGGGQAGHRTEMPAVGPMQPGPAEHRTGAQRLDNLITAARHPHVQGDAALLHQPEHVRDAALVEQALPGRERYRCAVLGQRPALGVSECGEERLSREPRGHRARHDSSSSLAATSCRLAKADTSAVMSMPAGHQAMHRPQPTHPDEPN